MTALGNMIRERVSDGKIDTLVALPEWKFCIVFAEGFYNDPCAGTTFEGVYYDEREIYYAYMRRNPDAEPLL